MKVYTIADHIISPLGSGTLPNFSALQNGQSGISVHSENELFPDPVCAAVIDRHALPFDSIKNYTFLENLFIHSIGETLKNIALPDKNRLILILSTTKGNIDLLGKKQDIDEKAIFLPEMAMRINRYFNFSHAPLVVSNACISGVSALLTAKKLIAAGLYDHAVVAGADVVSEFVLSGFHSFMALSDSPCQPYDKDRKGINIGEVCASVLLSNDPGLCRESSSTSEIAGGGQSNDANHISGPSRTGEGLIMAVEKALAEAGVKAGEIDYINAHGTATLYNDEMEAQAFDHLKMNGIPLNSLKGYYGHTLGGSGILESVLAVWQMNSNHLVQSAGYKEHGLTKPLNIIDKNTNKDIKTALKTSSGFGGCNGAVVFKKS